MPLARRGSQTLTIGDVARVSYGASPLIGTAVVNGGPGIMLVIEKFPGANTIDVTNGILKAFKELQPGLPGINVNTHIFRQANFIHTAIHNLVVRRDPRLHPRRVRADRVPVPVARRVRQPAGDSAVARRRRDRARRRGHDVNTMILAGFGVAVGVVVDDAIIDMENIVRRLRNWRAAGRRTTPLQLLLAASLEVRTAILYATLINIVAVLPVVFVGGLTGLVLPAARDRVRARRARLDVRRADRHAGARDGADAERAAATRRTRR